MKNINLITCALLLFILTFHFSVNASPNRVFSSYYGDSADDDLLDVAFADDGTLIVVGSTNSTDISLPSGTQSYVFGTDGATSSTAFILRLSNDGKTLLSYSRFAFGTIKSNNLRLAVTSNGIYMVGVAYSTFADTPNFDGSIDNVAGSKPAIVRIALDGSKILNATYLGGCDSDRDVNDIDVFPNGDLCVNHDNCGSSSDFLSRIKPDLSGYVWHISYYSSTGSSRSNAVSVSPQGDLVYVGGYGMGHTGLEPYKDPFLFCFSGDGQTQYWKRGTDPNDYGVFHFPQASIGKNRLISDSQINAIGTDSLGNALLACYSDGGATVLVYDPWYGGYNSTTGTQLPASVLDGDSFSGFAGATSASTLGRMGKDGKWIRTHTVKPYNTWNRWYGLARAYKDEVYYVGRTSGIPDVDCWEVGATTSVIMKTAMNAAGTNRKFVTHLAGVDAMNKIARDRNTYRYAAIGTAKTSGAYIVNGFQPNYSGGAKDGFIVIFDDNDRPAIAELNTSIADANVKSGTEVDKNFGTATSLSVKRRDSRSYETSKSYIKFDLSNINKPITDARFQIFKSGKYDFGNILVYALKEGSENWNENTITWNNAPANVINSPWELDKTKADSLGLWYNVKTNSTGIITYQGAAFTQYVENCRANGDKQITLVLTADLPTDQSDPHLSGSSKENTTNEIKPRLRIETEKPASVLTEISLWPGSAKLLPNESRLFYAIGFDQYGGIMSQAATFSVNNGGTILPNGMFSTTTPGIYTVKAEVGGLVTTAQVIIETTTDLFKTNTGIPSLRIFYVNGTISIISKNEEIKKVDLFDVYGRKVLSKEFSATNIQIPFQARPGVYFAKVQLGAKSYVHKIIVQ